MRPPILDDNLYPEGSLIFAKDRPTIPMVIRRYIGRIYYCRNQRDSAESERSYFEHELLPSVAPAK